MSVIRITGYDHGGDMYYRNTLKQMRVKVKPKRPENEFKVRHQYRNNVSQTTFKITKKFWLDIEWAYKVKYESGTEHVYTEPHFRYLVNEGRFRKIPTERQGHDGLSHFTEEELFRL